MVGRGSYRLHLALAALLLSIGTGCRSGISGNLAARPDSLAPRPTITAQAAIERHNHNAELITSLEARPGIIASAEGRRASVNGRMALEMPRNFTLEMGTTLKNVANIGSNDQGFWFWVENKKDPSIYVCSYEELPDTNLTATMQPDWIMEALGLRPITPEEAATIASTPGERSGTTWLTQRRRGENGEVLTKQMLIDETGQIREHRLYAGNKQTLLARAIIDEYKTAQLPNSPTDAEGKPATVFIPYRFRLEWKKENLALDVTMDNLKLNPRFADARREALFTEPSIPGTDRINLAKVAPKQAQASRGANNSSSYQRRTSRPSPPTSEVELGEPEPMSAEGARRTPRDPQALSADLREIPSSTRDRVVMPQLPRGVDP
jgi:hypothetical protein